MVIPNTMPLSPKTTIAGGITAIATQVTVTSAAVFPAVPFLAIITSEDNPDFSSWDASDYEVIEVGEVSGSTLKQIDRAVEGVAKAWPADSWIMCGVVAELFKRINAAIGEAATKGYVDDKDRPRVAVLTAAGAIIPETAGAEQEQIEGTYHSYFVCGFPSGSATHIFFHFVVPPDYQDGDITVKIYWIAPTKTSGNVTWNLATLGRGSNVAWDSSLGTAKSKQQTTAGTAMQVNICAFDAFNPGWAAGDVVIVKISRNGGTLAEDAHFLQASIEYVGR